MVDEANNRVVKLYADVEFPVYYRAMRPTMPAPKASSWRPYS